jgi:cytochrome c biogenesis protein CcmG, thiol:disulfide interchange protein DsbE
VDPRRAGGESLAAVTRRTITMRWLVSSLVLAVAAPAFAAQAGDRAADFTLKDMQGKTVKLSSLRGKVVVLDFWASWCVPCKKELPALDSLARRYAATKKDVVVVTVNIDKDRAKAQRFLASAKVVSLRCALDPDGGVASRYDLPAMPTSFVIDKNGIVRHVHAGFTPGDEAKLAREIDALLK